MRGAIRGEPGNAGQPQQRQHVRVVPLERYRERDHVEVADRRLRLERHERRARRKLRRELGLGRQEHPFANDVVFSVEEFVDGLEAQIRHPHEVRVRERQHDTELAAVRFAHVSHFLRQKVAGAFALLPDLAHVDSSNA